MPDRFPHHDASEIRALLLTGVDTLQSYVAESNVAISSSLGSGHFSTYTQHRRDDSMRVNIRVQLGIEAARLLFTPDSIFVYDRIKNTVYYGDISNATRLLPTPWISPELFLDVLGFPDTDLDENWDVTADSLRYYLTNEDGRVRLFVDPALWRVIRYEERNIAGELVEQKSYLDFSTFDDVLLPTRIVVRRPVDKVSATLQHRSIDLNPESMDLKFDVKENAEYVPIH